MNSLHFNFEKSVYVLLNVSTIELKLKNKKYVE